MSGLFGDDKLMEKLAEYKKAFKDGFPTIPLAWGRTDDEVIAIIDECLKKKRDVYRLGYVKKGEKVVY